MAMGGVEAAAFVPQVVDALQSWCTPTVLFLLLNIVIGTIAVTSRMRFNQNNPNNLRRSPSLLSRISSINFSKRAYEDQPLDTWSPQPDHAEVAEEKNVIVEQKGEMEEKQTSEAKGVDGGVVSTTGLSQRAVEKKTRLGRSKSDSQPLADLSPPPPLPLPGKMHKYGTFEAAHYTRKAAPPSEVPAVRPPPPPQTVEAVEEEGSGSDAEVNAKADDFINKFKQQLKLQRLESFMRYKETLRRN